ncbi:MAG: hypothetical protein AAFQ44_05305 [Pseudomonadota bacterium]
MAALLRTSLAALVFFGVASFFMLAVLNAIALDRGLTAFSQSAVVDVERAVSATAASTEEGSLFGGVQPGDLPWSASETRQSFPRIDGRSGRACALDTKGQLLKTSPVACEAIVDRIQRLRGDIGASSQIWATLGFQLLYVLMAAFIVAFGLALTLGIAAMIDWLGHFSGRTKTSTILQTVLETVPYPVWFILMLGVHASVAAALDYSLFPSSAKPDIIGFVAQAAVYFGIFCILLPTCVTFVIAMLRDARSDGLFSAMLMDGKSPFSIYVEAIRTRARAFLLKTFVFALAFLLCFEPLVQLITRGQIASYTSREETALPRNLSASPFYQWSYLRSGPLLQSPDARDLTRDWMTVRAAIVDETPTAADRLGLILASLHYVTTFGGAAAEPGLKMEQSDTGRAVDTNRLKTALFAMSQFPGARLDSTTWNGLIGREPASPQNREKQATAQRPDWCGNEGLCQTVRDDRGLSATFLTVTVHEAIAEIYFNVIYAIILLLFGWLTVMEFHWSTKRRVEKL